MTSGLLKKEVNFLKKLSLRIHEIAPETNEGVVQVIQKLDVVYGIRVKAVFHGITFIFFGDHYEDSGLDTASSLTEKELGYYLEARATDFIKDWPWVKLEIKHKFSSAFIRKWLLGVIHHFYPELDRK